MTLREREPLTLLQRAAAGFSSAERAPGGAHIGARPLTCQGLPLKKTPTLRAQRIAYAIIILMYTLLIAWSAVSGRLAIAALQIFVAVILL